MLRNSQTPRPAFDWASVTDWQGKCPSCGGDTEFNGQGGIVCGFCGYGTGDSVPADLIASYQRKQESAQEGAEQ